MNAVPHWKNYKFSFLPDGHGILATPYSVEEDEIKPKNTIDLLSKKDVSVVLSLYGLI